MLMLEVTTHGVPTVTVSVMVVEDGGEQDTGVGAVDGPSQGVVVSVPEVVIVGSVAQPILGERNDTTQRVRKTVGDSCMIRGMKIG
jgi:hypothetical protein